VRLYYSPGACSQAVHIVLRELGLPFEAVAVDLATKRSAGGEDLYQINAKGRVPALVLDDGTVLTECTAVLQYLAQRTSPPRLAPAPGTMAHYRLLEWLSYLGSELHQNFLPLFAPTEAAVNQEAARSAVMRRFDYIDRELSGRDYLLGDSFTVADAYLYVLVGWARSVGLDLERWPSRRRTRESARGPRSRPRNAPSTAPRKRRGGSLCESGYRCRSDTGCRSSRN
jgi:glutathione S-transferase